MGEPTAGLTRRRALSVGAAALTAAPAYGQETPAGKIDMVRGEVFAERAGTRRTLEPAGDVFVDDVVETGADSRLTMHLGKATIVKLGALAKFRIDKYIIDVGGTFDLTQGAVAVDRNDAARKERLQLRSPFGLIAVRGTLFFAGPSQQAFGVFVARGAVAVTGDGQTVTLLAGQGTDIAAPGAAPQAPRAWAPDRIAAAFASVG